jgi:hypothetical protein
LNHLEHTSALVEANAIGRPDHLTYTLISRLLIGASRFMLAYFLPSLTIFLFYISHSIQPLNLKLGSSLKHLR